MSDSEEGETHRGMARSDSSPAVCSSPTNKNRPVVTEGIEEVMLTDVPPGMGMGAALPAGVPAGVMSGVADLMNEAGRPSLYTPFADDMAGIPTAGSDGSNSDLGDSPHTESLHRSRSVPNLSFGGQQGADIMAALNKEKREGSRGKASADSSASLKLHHEWTIWFDKSNRKARKGGHTIYEDCIVELGTFSTVQGFWTYWDSLHVHNLKDHCNLRVFKKGIKPLWEDPMNKKGGKWVVRGVPKANRKHLWTTLITHLIAGKLADNSEQTVCGVVLSTRDNGDSMQLWQDGGLTFVGTLETPEQKAVRLLRPSTDNMLKELLFKDSDETYTEFIYQTHYELQHTGANKEKSSYHAARDTLDPSSAAAMAGAALNTVGGAKADSDDLPQSPTAFQGQQTLMAPHMAPEIIQQQQQGQQMHQGQQGQQGQPGQQSQQGQQGQLGGMMGGGMIPGMLPGMLPITRVAGMMPMMMGNQQMLFGNVGNYGMMSAGMLPGAQVGNIGGFNNMQQSQSSQQSGGQNDGWARQSDDSDDEDDLQQEGTEVSEPVRAIQERAKLIRTVRKKIRYINFFLQRQGKGRELTSAEKQRVKSLPFLQRELQLLEEQQNKEVETQKRLLGVDSLDFLRKPQQPMTYANESEKRFKTMRAIRKKIRFIHYHLERQRQGKVLSPAEIAKVNALPEFEKKLAELEAEEARAVEASQGAFPAGGAVPATQSPITPTTPSTVTPTPATLGPAAASVGGAPGGHMPLNQQAGAGMNRPMHSHAPLHHASVASMPQHQQQPQQQQPHQAVQVAGVSQHSPPHILELQAQIEAQRRELEEKQKHIEFLIRQQPTPAMPGGPVYVSPGPPPLESPGTITGLNGPMSPVGGLPPQTLQQQPGGNMTQVVSASHVQSI